MRKILADIGIVAAILLALVFTTANSPKDQFYGSFTPETTYSFDGMYYAVQNANKGMIHVMVYDAETCAKVASFSPARAADFWGICWAADSYDIWTQSADIGVHCWSFDGTGWVLNVEAEQPEYIIPRWDEEYRNDPEKQKDMYVSPK